MQHQELYIERIGNFALMPIVHHSYEFTLAVRDAFEQLNPCAVAVEYPFVYQDLILQGINRLPRISILLYGGEQNKDHSKAQQNFIRIEPIDPFVEALRLAKEKKIAARCIDLALTNYPQVYQPLPDTYALTYLGHRKYCEMVLEKSSSNLSSLNLSSLNNIDTTNIDIDDLLNKDLARESAMAFHAHELERKLTWTKKIDPARPILLLCGIAHLQNLKVLLQKDLAHPVEEKPHAQLYHLSPQSLGEIMGHFPFFSAVYELQRSGKLPAQLIKNNTKSNDDVNNENENRVDEFDRLAADTAHNARHTFKLIKGVKLAELSELAIRAQQDTAMGASNGDRNEILTRYILWCRAYYEQEINERINPQRMLLLKNFARKYAYVKQHLLPDFYELLIAGRSCLNSHFCYRMWEIGNVYAAQQGASELPVIELRAEDIFPLINRVRMNPHAPLKPCARLPKFLSHKDKQKQQNDLNKLKFDPHSICSYPPEDLIIEGYGQYLRTKGKNILSEERKRVRPFETSLLDGIDLRETIRNWHTGKLYVQESATIKGSVDSLVVIFDEDEKNYPYTMTWLGENQQESDMAFYATDPEERHVGPGIRKAVYGGLMMVVPPGRLFDVFRDPAYSLALNYAEKLLMAALDYSLEKFVIYAAQKPPRPFFQVLAGRYGKRILYIPLKQLSPIMLQKIKSFHILSSKSVRKYAKDYIW